VFILHDKHQFGLQLSIRGSVNVPDETRVLVEMGCVTPSIASRQGDIIQRREITLSERSDAYHDPI
jgi:hypothetical protein